MTQYNELIERKAKELEAEEWGNQVKMKNLKSLRKNLKKNLSKLIYS